MPPAKQYPKFQNQGQPKRMEVTTMNISVLDAGELDRVVSRGMTNFWDTQGHKYPNALLIHSGEANKMQERLDEVAGRYHLTVFVWDSLPGNGIYFTIVED